MMLADLVKLLDLQSKDAALAEVEGRLTALGENSRGLDQAHARARESVEAARRAMADGERRRDELEVKIESYRTLQNRRSQRLEHVRNPKEASTLMAELDLAKSVMAKEEGDWVRSADAVVQLELKAQGEELNLKAVEAAQAPERTKLAERRAALEAERDAALRERDNSAGLIDKTLRTRYERLRRTRSNDVVVPVLGGSCGGCHTAIPLNRRTQIRAGTVVDSCEGCGAILYPPESDGSA
ncbi:MAG TPA: C4-type zinc ribbon domain-containing protein [Gemmatimonadales bacterium]|jgi:predicted  nucleic acid-binding Zn-ribbon protein|nr:C4-type zinc ribbon domain-containing protein [Gemmatimonadales bacterium]